MRDRAQRRDERGGEHPGEGQGDPRSRQLREQRPASIYELGQGLGGQGQNSAVVQTLLRTGNWDAFHGSTQWGSSGAQSLPSSLYRNSKPAWWPSGMSWPWVGPDLNPMVQTLPAKARSDGM
jgi:hypothetical protein